MIPYDRGHVPPAPVLQVTVAGLARRRREIVPALLDTGSDITAIPHVCGNVIAGYDNESAG